MGEEVVHAGSFLPTYRYEGYARVTDRLHRIYDISIFWLSYIRIRTYLTSLIYMPVASLFTRAHHSWLVNFEMQPEAANQWWWSRHTGFVHDTREIWELRHADAVFCGGPIGRVDKLYIKKAEVVISEDELHAVAVCILQPANAAAEELNFPFTPISWISIGIPKGVNDMQRILFLLYLPTCMFHPLSPSPNPCVVVVVSHLLAT